MNDSEQREGVLPCPLCGGEASEAATAMYATIRCGSCRLECDQMRGPLDAHTNEAMPSARNRWNTRAFPERVVTDEMVEYARIAETERRYLQNEHVPPYNTMDVIERERDRMRAALEAALKGKP